MVTHRHVPASAPPVLRGGLPVLGHALPFSRDPVRFLVDAQKRLGDVFTIRLGGRRFTVFCGPDASDAIFRSSDYAMGRRRAYRSMTPVLGEGIFFDLPPEEFKEHVGFLHPALAAKSVTMYREAMLEEVENYVAGWGDEGTIDLVDVMSELSIFIATRCMVGPDFRRRVGADLVGLFDDLKAAGRMAVLVAPHLPLPAFRRRDRARRRLIELITDAIRCSQVRHSDTAADPLIDHLLQCRYSDGRSVPEDVIASLLLAVVVAGEHNTAAVAAWTGLLLLQDPDRLSLVVDEQANFVGPDDDLRGLGELRKCVTEAGRMHPPTTLLLRDVEEDFTYKGYRVRRGTTVMLSPGASHRLPHVFTDPDRYNPDRFADRQPGNGPDPLITFGGGSHRCTGKNFAYQEIMVMWNVLLRHFDLELVDTGPRPDYNAVTAIPLKPCRLRYRRRGSTPPHIQSDSSVAASSGRGPAKSHN